jgi:DNA-binding response OmpR family regulator
MAKTILVVDDENDIRQLLRYNLEREGYQVLSAKTGDEGLDTARSKKPDAVILDLMLPGGIDGLEVCRLLKSDRATRHIPILMLTAKGTETDQVVGFELGADDYIAKPFSVKVLLVRVKNALKRKEAAGGAPVRVGDAEIDRERQTFTMKGRSIPLTKLEFRILAFLMENRGRVFTRDKLLSGAWEGEAFVVDRTVDVHIRSIRKKMGKQRDYIETVRGSGYRFVEEGPRV